MVQDKAYQALIRKVAGNVSRIRRSRGLTQEDMIAKGYSYRHYQRVESGRYSPNLHTLFRLSQTFKVDVREFFK